MQLLSSKPSELVHQEVIDVHTDSIREVATGLPYHMYVASGGESTNLSKRFAL